MSDSAIDRIISGGRGCKNHHDLDAWRASIDLATSMYRLTESFPNDERYALTGQIRRAAVSVAASRAEGASRPSSREFLRFACVARSSLVELETLLIIAQRSGLTSVQDTTRLAPEVNLTFALLSGLIRWLRSEEERV